MRSSFYVSYSRITITATTREWSWWCTVHPQASLLFEEADAVGIVLVLLCLLGGLSYCQGRQLFIILTRVTSKILVIWDETEILPFVDKEYKAYLLPSTISFIKVWFLCYQSSAVVLVVRWGWISEWVTAKQMRVVEHSEMQTFFIAILDSHNRESFWSMFSGLSNSSRSKMNIG